MSKSNYAAKEVEEVAESLGCIGITPKAPVVKLQEVEQAKTTSKSLKMLIARQEANRGLG